MDILHDLATDRHHGVSPACRNPADTSTPRYDTARVARHQAHATRAEREARTTDASQPRFSTSSSEASSSVSMIAFCASFT